eukprot:645008-Prymnesium_polylepis.1
MSLAFSAAQPASALGSTSSGPSKPCRTKRTPSRRPWISDLDRTARPIRHARLSSGECVEVGPLPGEDPVQVVGCQLRPRGIPDIVEEIVHEVLVIACWHTRVVDMHDRRDKDADRVERLAVSDDAARLSHNDHVLKSRSRGSDGDIPATASWNM